MLRSGDHLRPRDFKSFPGKTGHKTLSGRDLPSDGATFPGQHCTYSISWQRSNEAGVAASQQGKYAEAEKYYLAALKEAESFAPEDPRLAASLNNLATLYDTQGKYAEAEPLYQRSLAILEKALGPEHPLVATSLDRIVSVSETPRGARLTRTYEVSPDSSQLLLTLHIDNSRFGKPVKIRYVYDRVKTDAVTP